MALPAFLTDIIGWLRAGYPEGVPDHDYIPPFALLGRHLTDSEVREIADELAASGDQHCARAIYAAINAVTNEHPLDSDSDIARVRVRLAAGGWPLAKPGPF
jgi:hypothetical protein